MERLRDLSRGTSWPWLNIFSILTAIVFVVDSWMNHHHEGALSRMYYVPVFIILASFVWLWLLHPKMDAMLDPEQMSVESPDEFYQLHRVYLWVSTFQWLALMCMVWKLSVLLPRRAEVIATK